MMLVRMKSYDDYTTEILSKGHHYVDVALNELVFFVRNNKAIPFNKTAENTSKIDLKSIKLVGYENSSYTMYSDNGYSPNIKDCLTITTIS